MVCFQHDMWADDYERDVQDRLRWQYQIQKDLYGYVSVPEPYGLFQEKEGTYLAMQYVKGQDLGDVVREIYAYRGWQELHRDEKMRLLSYLLQIIDQCEKLHLKGYIHRDLALTNFIVDKKDKLVMIDMELAYLRNNEKQLPPFRLGTYGFMSPEQIKTIIPTEKEDIYALGAVMIQLLTGVHPIKFGVYFTHELTESLSILNGSKRIGNLITQCLQANPDERPSLLVIKENLEKCRKEPVSDQSVSKATPQGQTDITFVSEVLKESLNGLCQLLSGDPIQLKYKEIEDGTTPTQTLELGWYHGLSGALYLLAKTAPHLSVPGLEMAFARGYQYVHQYQEEIFDKTGSLYSGVSGIALTMAEGLNSGLLQNTPERKDELWQFLKVNNPRLDFAHGIAGQGMTILRSMPYLDKELAGQWLEQHVGILLDTQQSDGSWGIGGNKKMRNASFPLGHPGIVFFLLHYLEFSPDPRLREALYKALNWMCSRPAKTVGSYRWLTKNNYKTINLGLDGELAGIALSCIAAYQQLQDPAYKTCAEEILRQLPHNLVCQDFSLTSGLAGLGHVYLEAWSQLENDEWRNRADAVANLLGRSSYRQNSAMRFWLVENNKPAHGNLMPGAGGVMDFLMHYLTLNKNPSSVENTYPSIFRTTYA